MRPSLYLLSSFVPLGFYLFYQVVIKHLELKMSDAFSGDYPRLKTLVQLSSIQWSASQLDTNRPRNPEKFQKNSCHTKTFQLT